MENGTNEGPEKLGIEGWLTLVEVVLPWVFAVVAAVFFAAHLYSSGDLWSAAILAVFATLTLVGMIALFRRSRIAEYIFGAYFVCFAGYSVFYWSTMSWREIAAGFFGTLFTFVAARLLAKTRKRPADC